MTGLRLLDLFCCQGGAAMGYHRAGFEVVGVDCDPQPRYPFEFVRDDALEFLAENWQEFHVIHASPPCRDHTPLTSVAGTDGSAWLLQATRYALQGRGPYVIENVAAAPMVNPITLCGTAMTGSPQTDPRLEAGIERLLMSHPSWFKRLSTSRARSPEHSDHADVRYAAQTIVEAVLRAIDAADEASGVRRVTAQELADQFELARQEERQRIAAEIESVVPASARYMPRDAYNGMCDAYRHAVSIARSSSSAADSPVGGVS